MRHVTQHVPHIRCVHGWETSMKSKADEPLSSNDDDLTWEEGLARPIGQRMRTGRALVFITVVCILFWAVVYLGIRAAL